ncbi:GGDEF domain-containing protein [Microvirga calopogonii]|uniref:GGDEF domain-containing protein n=1 Tax=Microvirga calopogonii TaxID=2078013 RepID=UPI000E0D3469|nr:GGDEF domain-containing protein [Microvirga calopogonii]
MTRCRVGRFSIEGSNDHRARHDVLTGLPNRRFLMETSETLGSHSMVFAIVDIDHFKIVNDTHGHRIGDVVLQTVGALMATHLAAYGMVGRLGGEEFALIAPEASAEQVIAGLSELLRTVEATPIVASGVTIHVTLSAGVAIRKVSEPFDKAYAEADAALYRAKRVGRNRIELARST